MENSPVFTPKKTKELTVYERERGTSTLAPAFKHTFPEGKEYRIGGPNCTHEGRQYGSMIIKREDGTFKAVYLSWVTIINYFAPVDCEFYVYEEDAARMSFFGSTYSIIGNCVEPDGVDPEGYPSWPLAWGVI